MAPETPYNYWFLSKITLCIWLLKHLAAIGSPKSPYALWLLKTPYGAIGSSKSPNAFGSSNILRLLVPQNHLMHMAPQTPSGYWFPQNHLMHKAGLSKTSLMPSKDLEQAGSEKSHLAIWLALGLIPRTTPFSGLSTKITAVQNSTTSCLAPGPLGLVSPYLRHSPRTHESLS